MRLHGARLQMRYEVVENYGEWIVRRGGQEVARFDNQEKALNEVAARLREADATQTAALSVRYQMRPL
jgi:hypothetical protein